MAQTNKERDQEFDRFAALLGNAVNQLSPDLIQDPKLGEVLVGLLTNQLNALLLIQSQVPPPPDQGLGQLAGIGPEAAPNFGAVRSPDGVTPYDEAVTSERILALGDLYYIYQHEMIGVFRVTLKLQELFKAGVVRLSSGPGAFALYQFDRRQVLRYTKLERLQAYLRAFGYTCTMPAPGAMPNRLFQKSFSHFISQVAIFFRDKRISEVIRERATDPSFGSIAIVRRAGLDLRYNLKQFSYGHLNVMRVEVLQLLEEAFKILNSDDIRRLFGAENAWEVIEDVLRRYFQEYVNASQRSRMAINGREILRWLAEPHILARTRAEFEALLLQIAEPAEEWLSSAQALGAGDQARNGANGANGAHVAAAAVPRQVVFN